MGGPPDPEGRGGYDPYAAAAERIAARAEAARAEGRTAERGAGGPAPPDALRAPSRHVGGKILIGAAFLLLLQQIGAARRPPAPTLAPNCTAAAFKLSANTVKQARPLTYTIVGPDGHRFVLGVDTASFVHNPDGGWSAVPLQGADDSFEVAAGVKPMKGCRRTGLFSLPIPLGEHTVTLYELTDTGAVELERQTITVTAD